jgi:hypothetical protein
MEKLKANKKSDRLTNLLVNDFQKFKNTTVSSKSSELDDEILAAFIRVLENKLLDDSLPKAETVRIMKLISILDWEREKATVSPENIDQKINIAKRLQKKSQSGFE